MCEQQSLLLILRCVLSLLLHFLDLLAPGHFRFLVHAGLLDHHVEHVVGVGVRLNTARLLAACIYWVYVLKHLPVQLVEVVGGFVPVLVLPQQGGLSETQGIGNLSF